MSKILYLIPARGGSKGVPGKNIKPLAGKPLIYYTIDAAREVAQDDDIIVSTDDESIKQKVEQYGLNVPFMRPTEIATDNASTEDVILHTISAMRERGVKYDTIVLLQPTSPFRTGKHIQEALALFDNTADMIISVKETSVNPYYVLLEEEPDGILKKVKEGNFTRRQDCPKVYEINGALYVFRIADVEEHGMKGLTRKKKYLMGENESLDIDSELDWKLCEEIMKDR